MKTTDVRIFGWFHRRCQSVAVCGGMKRDVKKRGQVDELRREVVALRRSLPLDEPRYVGYMNSVRELL